MTDDGLRGGEELHYKRLLGDVHRALVGGYEVKANMYSGNILTKERLRTAYGEVKEDAEVDEFSRTGPEDLEQDPVRDIEKALVFGWYDQSQNRFGMRPSEAEQYLNDEDFYTEATDGGDLEAFYALGEDAPSMQHWYEATVETLENWGYDEPEAMLEQLATEVRWEPDDDDGLIDRLQFWN